MLQIQGVILVAAVGAMEEWEAPVGWGAALHIHLPKCSAQCRPVPYQRAALLQTPSPP